MAKWNSYTELSSAELADADLLPVSDDSEASGSKDKTTSVGALRAKIGAGFTVLVTQASHGLSVGDAVRHTGSAYAQATADTAANAELVGVVTTVPDTGTFTYQTAGLATGLTGLTAGELYYLQDDGSVDTTAGTVSRPMLVAVSTTAAVLVLSFPGDAADTSGLLPKLATVSSEAGNHTLDADDSGAYVRITAAGTVTLPDSLATGFQCVIVNATDSDTVALSAATTLTIPSGFDAEVQNRRAVTVIHVGSNVWEAHGALVESA